MGWSAVSNSAVGSHAPNMNYWHLASALGLEHWTLFSDDPLDPSRTTEGPTAGSVHAAVNPVLQVVEDVLLRKGGRMGPRRPLAGGLIAGGEAQGGDALLSMLETDPDAPAGSVATGGVSEGNATLSGAVKTRLRKALSLHAHKIEGVGEHVMVIRADEVTGTAAIGVRIRPFQWCSHTLVQLSNWFTDGGCLCAG